MCVYVGNDGQSEDGGVCGWYLWWWYGRCVCLCACVCVCVSWFGAVGWVGAGWRDFLDMTGLGLRRRMDWHAC